MINEGGKWAHVVLRKCVFEPKAVRISSLMHQPSTGHLRSTVCCAVSSVPAERRCIDSPKTPSRSLAVFLFFSFLFLILYFMSLPCLFFHTSFHPSNYPFPASLFRILNLSFSSSLTSFLHHATASLGLHTPYNSISVFCVCFFASVWFRFISGIGATANTQPSQPKHWTFISSVWHHRLV